MINVVSILVQSAGQVLLACLQGICQNGRTIICCLIQAPWPNDFCPGKKYTPEYSTLDNYLTFDCKLMACYSELELVGPYYRACIVSILLQNKQSPNIKTKVPLHSALTYTMPKVKRMATNRHCLLFFLFSPKRALNI